MPRIAIGPQCPDWGSWDWVGADLGRELSEWYETSFFEWGNVPDCELVLVVKHKVPDVCGGDMARLPPVVYCPIDQYGTAREIDGDAPWLRRCARIVIHCERLRRFFSAYAPVEYIDHHAKFVGEMQSERQTDGPLLWVGVRSNLRPLVEWVNANPLPRELIVLTNPEVAGRTLKPADYGFRPNTRVRLEAWSTEHHLNWLPRVAGAIDVKGKDFRQRHKPPAKALDFIAAGVPLAMNSDSSSSEHLARMGFELAVPTDVERWLSGTYWEETRRFGSAIRELLSLERIARRFRRVIDEVLAQYGVVEAAPLMNNMCPES